MAFQQRKETIPAQQQYVKLKKKQQKVFRGYKNVAGICKIPAESTTKKNNTPAGRK